MRGLLPTSCSNLFRRRIHRRIGIHPAASPVAGRSNSSAGVPKKAQSRPESAVAASPFQGHASVPREPLQKQMREYPAIIDGNENN